MNRPGSRARLEQRRLVGHLPLSGKQILALLLAAVVIAGVVWLTAWAVQLPAEFALIVPLMLAGQGAFVIAIIVHECAHAVAARCVGGHVQSIVIGSGTSLARVKLFGLLLDVRQALWGGGLCYSYIPQVRWHRTRHAIVYAAGPLADLAGLTLAIAMLAGWPWPDGNVRFGAAFFAVPYALATLMGLWMSWRSLWHAGGPASDFACLRALCSWTPAQIEYQTRVARLHLRTVAGRWSELLDEIGLLPDDDHRRLLTAGMLWRVGAAEAALLEIERAIESRRLDPGSWDAVIPKAWLLAMQVDDDQRDAAERWSALAMERFEQEPYARLVRGIMLARRGQHRIARRMLRKAQAMHLPEPESRAICALYLALGWVVERQRRRAAKLLRRARRLAGAPMGARAVRGHWLREARARRVAALSATAAAAGRPAPEGQAEAAPALRRSAPPAVPRAAARSRPR